MTQSLRHPFNQRLILSAMLLTTGSLAMSQTIEATDTFAPTQMKLRATFEAWKIPDKERAGVVGLSALVDVNPNISLGVSSYSAVTGDSGGLMAFGFTGELNKDLTADWALRGGIFAGGGGGAAAANTTGVGLMIRADTGIVYRMGKYGNIGLGLSWVSFPSGDLQSTQPYISYEYPLYSTAHSGWLSGDAPGSLGSLPARKQELAANWSYLKTRDSDTNKSGDQSSNIEVAGVRWTTYLHDRWFASVQADGSYTDSTSGYTQILGGFGYRLPLGSRTGLKLFTQVGAAGAGNSAVDTGGGLLLGGGLALQQILTDHWAIELSAGGLKAATGDFEAWTFGINLSYLFGTPIVTDSATVSKALENYQSTNWQIRAVNQTFLKADDQWRNNDDVSSVNNLGIALDYYVNRNAYLTGQGLVAYTGNSRSTEVTAAAELTGLLGAGWDQPITTNWHVKGEALVGASVGGTMDTGNGFVWQLNAGVGYHITDNVSLALSIGRMQAFDGEFKSNVVSASLGWRFSLPTQ